MFLKWFDTKIVEAFAESVTGEYLVRVTADVANRKIRGADKILTDARQLCLSRVEKFVSTTPLNLYKRAKLANLIRWKLSDAGLEKALVEDLTLAVAKQVAVRRANKN